MASLSAYYPQPVVAGTTAGTYAEGDHSHELDELDASGIAAGKVLTANGSNAATWEDSTGQVEEAPEDGIIYGRKDTDWVDITEPANLQIRRGTAAEVAAITPLEGEPVWETDTKKLVVGDGLTAGGVAVGKFPLDGALRNVTSPTSPQAGSIFVGEEVDNRGGIGLGKPYVEGNSRGSGAVDLQTQRIQATQVAAGVFSFIASGNNCSVDAFAGYSSILSSSATSITGARSVAVSCFSKTISGSDSFSVNSNISASYCFAVQGTADRRNMFVQGSAGSVTGFGATERAQAVQVVLKGRTTNATPSQLVIDNTPVYLTIPENVALFGQVEICAIEETNATEAAHYVRKFGIQNLGGTTTLIGTVTTVGTDYESDAGYDVAITADDAFDYLKIGVTGDASKTLRWMAVVRGVEMDIS